MFMETLQNNEQMEVVQMRFGVIAPLVQGTYLDISMTAYCRHVAQTPLRLPDGGNSSINPRLRQNGISSMPREAWRLSSSEPTATREEPVSS